MTARTPLLLLVPPLRACRHDDGKYYVTRKFVSGVLEYQKYWDGDVEVILEASPVPDSNLDPVAVDTIQEFRLQIRDLASIEQVLRSLDRPTAVLTALGRRYARIPGICKRLGFVCVPVSENTYRTRCQIVAASGKSLLRRLWGYWSEFRKEIYHRKAIRESSAIQCNGLPTYENYRKLNPNSLLYFDSRVSSAGLIEKAALERRLSLLKSGNPLRLLFSGRLHAIKGADHLILFADELRRAGTRFDLTICGDGELRPWIESEVARRGLQDHVRLTGTLDFETELLDVVKNEADIFVCCHRQGDPSCTYLETLSCGVPIAGYDNEAFAGMHRMAAIGWKVPMNDYRALARCVAELDQKRDEIVACSRNALEFASDHVFEKTFESRIDQLRDLVTEPVLEHRFDRTRSQ